MTFETRRVNTGAAFEYRIIGGLLSGRLHSPSPNEPASIFHIDGTKLYHDKGELHRDGGQPAIESGSARIQDGKAPYEYWEHDQQMGEKSSAGDVTLFDREYRARMLRDGIMYRTVDGKIRVVAENPDAPELQSGREFRRPPRTPDGFMPPANEP